MINRINAAAERSGFVNTVNVRGLEIGTGRPKIAVPLTGAAREDLIAQANTLPGLGADLAEWRMDCFAQVENGAAVAACLRDLRRSLGEMPLLATFRTDREGGAHPLSAQSYAALNETVLSSGQADLIDVELFSDGDCVPHLIAAAHSAGVSVVLSSHDFEKTPPKDELVRRLCRMQELGADLLKIAVMPRCRNDVLTLLQATEEMLSRHARTPLITMSMGDLGMVTRICGGFFGSAVTFGAATQASAPGQLPLERLHTLLSLMPCPN